MSWLWTAILGIVISIIIIVFAPPPGRLFGYCFGVGFTIFCLIVMMLPPRARLSLDFKYKWKPPEQLLERDYSDLKEDIKRRFTDSRRMTVDGEIVNMFESKEFGAKGSPHQYLCLIPGSVWDNEKSREFCADSFLGIPTVEGFFLVVTVKNTGVGPDLIRWEATDQFFAGNIEDARQQLSAWIHEEH